MDVRRRLLGTAGLVVAASVVLVAPASAVHLFPVTPGFDPLGHDCAQNLADAPQDPGSSVDVVGFNFVDSAARTSTTEIEAGQAVTWTWRADHCHSVTFADGRGTRGADGFMPAQPELVRIGDGGDSFTLTFGAPGTYEYQCVHHAAVGMTGVVEVVAASGGDAGDGPGSGGGGGGAAAGSAPRPAVAPELPATGSRPSLAYAVAALAAVVGAAVLRRAARG